MASKIDDERAVKTCKKGQGAECCRYLAMGRVGFECLKLSSLRKAIDQRVQGMIAQGDNCDGVE